MKEEIQEELANPAGSCGKGPRKPGNSPGKGPLNGYGKTGWVDGDG